MNSTVINSNASVASKLDEIGRLLEDQGANTFRVAAYRRGEERERQCSARIESWSKGTTIIPRL